MKGVRCYLLEVQCIWKVTSGKWCWRSSYCLIRANVDYSDKLTSMLMFIQANVHWCKYLFSKNSCEWCSPILGRLPIINEMLTRSRFHRINTQYLTEWDNLTTTNNKFNLSRKNDIKKMWKECFYYEREKK